MLRTKRTTQTVQTKYRAFNIKANGIYTYHLYIGSVITTFHVLQDDFWILNQVIG